MLLRTGLGWLAMLLNSLTLAVLQVGTGNAWWWWPALLFPVAILATLATGVISVAFAILNWTGKRRLSA